MEILEKPDMGILEKPDMGILEIPRTDQTKMAETIPDFFPKPVFTRLLHLIFSGYFTWNFSTGVDNKLLLQNRSNGSAFAGQIDWIYAGNGLLTMDNVNYLVNQF